MLAIRSVYYIGKPVTRDAPNRGKTCAVPGRSSITLRGNTRRVSACVKRDAMCLSFFRVTETKSGEHALLSTDASVSTNGAPQASDPIPASDLNNYRTRCRIRHRILNLQACQIDQMHMSEGVRGIGLLDGFQFRFRK